MDSRPGDQCHYCPRPAAAGHVVVVMQERGCRPDCPRTDPHDWWDHEGEPGFVIPQRHAGMCSRCALHTEDETATLVEPDGWNHDRLRRMGQLVDRGVLERPDDDPPELTWAEITSVLLDVDDILAQGRPPSP